MIVGLHNYLTGKDENMAEMPTNWAPYIPQTQAAQNLYRLLTERMGKSPLEAAERILTIACGETPKEE